MSTARRVLHGLRAVLAADALRLFSRGLIVLLLTRLLLDPSQYGLLFFAMSVLGVVMLFSNLGLAKSAARFVTEYRETDPGQIPHVLRSAFTYNLVVLVAVSAVLAAFSGHIAAFLGEPGLAPLLLVGAGYVVGKTLVSFSFVLCQGLGRVDRSAVVRTVESASLPVFVVAFVLFGLGALGALLGYVVSALLAAVVGLGILYGSHRDYRDGSRREDGLGGRILRYSVPLTATRGANVLDKRIDTILVGFFINPVAVGFYTLAKQITDFVVAPAHSLGFTVSPTYGEQQANDEIEAASELYQTTLEYVLLFYVPAAAGLVLVAEPAIRLLFGARYTGTVPVLQVMCGFVVLQSITVITSDGLDYLGRARVRALAKGGTSVANFLLNLVLIPSMGVVGAAVATVITHAVYVAVNVFVVHRELSLSLGRLARTVALVSTITLAMSATVLLSMPYVSGLLTLAAVVLAGGLIWGTMAVVTGAVDVRTVARMAQAD